jgi:Oxidoreductase FAD-binding domain
MDSESNANMEWQIVQKTMETPDTYTYSFSPIGSSNTFSFEVGQFVTISVLLKRPTEKGALEEREVERSYSISSSPTRNRIDLTIKDEKPYGFMNPTTHKADGFAAYFFEQMRIGDRVKVRLNQNKNHFLSKIAAGIEKNIAYWSGSNGAESARCLLQFMDDIKDPDLRLSLFYSNPRFSGNEGKNLSHIIYYEWLIEMAKKLENFQVIFTFTREKKIPLFSDHPRIVYRIGRFFVDPKSIGLSETERVQEKTLSKYHGGDIRNVFNPICGSSGFINGTVKSGTTGKILKGRGIMQDLLEIEGVNAEKIDKEQYYLQYVQ